VFVLLEIAKILTIIGCGLGLAGTTGLMVRRLVIHELKSFSSFGAYFNLAFLMSIYLTGLVAVATIPDYMPRMTQLFMAVFTFQFGFSLPAAAAVHVVLACAFFIYLPFTYMMHFVAKYFTYHEIRWNDEPMTAGSKMEKEVTSLLGQKISWSADHIKGEGKKTWVDAATEEVKQ
jgi:nitrate reductase gamma subunit